MNHPSFTAAQIATALGRNRSSVHRVLKPLPPDRIALVGGNEASHWSIASLPGRMVAELETIAKREGYPNAETFVEQCWKPWVPKMPVSHCDPECIAEARKLREALRPSLERQKLSVNGAEFERLGVDDYETQFGRRITVRHWRNLFARTIQRAGPKADFERLEIYLRENPRLKALSNSKADKLDISQNLERVRMLLESFTSPESPTRKERDSFWTETMLAHEELQAELGDAKAGRLIRAELLLASPWLRPNPEALQKSYSRKLEAWRASGGSARAIVDGRSENGREKFEIPQADIDKIINLAVYQYHGHISAAWRAAHQRKLLTAPTIERFPLAASKSQVPHPIRDAIGPEVSLFMRFKRGPRAVDEMTPHVTRNYDGIHSCDVYNADDFTFPVYFYQENADGKFELTRGQCLLVICYRSRKVVGWTLIPSRNYSSFHIWGIFTRIFSELAVPNELYLERGIWKSSKLVAGSDRGLKPEERVQGLRRFGLKITHAIRPRSKPVERVGGLLQDLMEGEPGYCGRDERRDIPEHTKKAKQDVEFNRIHPSERFMDFDGWFTRLGEIIAKYNETPQEGLLEGLSPNQAFDRFINPNNPPIQFSPAMRSMLAKHQEVREVQTSGVQFRVGKTPYRYYGPELDKFVGRRMLCWFDPDNPEFLVVTDLHQRNPFLVPLAIEVPAMTSITGGEEILQSELGRAKGQMGHLKARFQVIKSAIPLPHRPMLASRADVRTAEQIESLQASRAKKERTVERNQRSAAEIGMHLPRERLADQESEADLKLLADFLKEPQQP